MLLLEKKFSPQNYRVRLQVEEEDVGLRLDQFVQLFLASFSRQEVKKRISRQEISIDSRSHKAKASSKLQLGEIVNVQIPKSTQEDEYWRGEKIKLVTDPEVIFEDQQLLVISKPAYMSTHPTGKHIFNCATVYFEEQTQKTVHSIHRLDRETSGVLLLAKNPKCAQIMTDHFESERVSKAYFFIAVEAKETSNSFEAKERLGPKEEGLKRIHIHAFPKDSKQGKHAHTKFKILYRENGYTLGLAFPQTGRQHQIRVHAMVHGLPLLGDKIYLGSFEMFQRFKDRQTQESDYELMQLSRHALHSIALSIPYQGQRKLFRSSLPLDFRNWIQENLSCSIDQLNKNIEKDLRLYLSQSDRIE